MEDLELINQLQDSALRYGNIANEKKKAEHKVKELKTQAQAVEATVDWKEQNGMKKIHKANEYYNDIIEQKKRKTTLIISQHEEKLDAMRSKKDNEIDEIEKEFDIKMEELKRKKEKKIEELERRYEGRAKSIEDIIENEKKDCERVIQDCSVHLEHNNRKIETELKPPALIRVEELIRIAEDDLSQVNEKLNIWEQNHKALQEESESRSKQRKERERKEEEREQQFLHQQRLAREKMAAKIQGSRSAKEAEWEAYYNQ